MLLWLTFCIYRLEKRSCGYKQPAPSQPGVPTLPRRAPLLDETPDVDLTWALLMPRTKIVKTKKKKKRKTTIFRTVNNIKT